MMDWEHWGYLGVLLVLVACSLGLPLPEDVPLLMGGLLCYKEITSLWLMIPIGMVGVLSGDMVLFYLGRRFGHHVVEHRWLAKLVNPSRLLTAERMFARHGMKIIFIGRFLPGLRPMIWVACGVLKVPFWLFLAVNGAAACISVPTLILLGSFFGHSIDRVQEDVRTVTHVIAIVLLASLLIALGVYFHRRQRRLIAATGGETPVDAAALTQIDPAEPAPPRPEPAPSE